VAVIQIHHIDTLEHPNLMPYRTLRRTAEHENNGIFVAEGEKVVARLIESDLEIQSFLITPEWLKIYRDRMEQREGTISVFVGEKRLLNSIVGFHLHQGIMAVAEIPKAQTIEEVVRRSLHPHLFVAVDGMTNSENLGVLVRNCAAFGVQALIVGETSSSPYLRRAVRNSMGAIFKLPVVTSANLAATLRDLAERFAVRVIGAHPHAQQTFTGGPALTGDCCPVFGSEGYGISADVLASCSEAVAIPMERAVDSLNVSSASAVFLYEVIRQRNKGSD
jgi:tRNA G18 (ribose-2'-O)-methylase SpoU